jgi:hypothetical protein
MIGLEQELLQEVDWRTNELSIIITIPRLCNCNDKQTEILEKYSAVAIYSIWEGFVTQSFTLYIREINNLKLSYEIISLNILTHDIFIKYGLTEEQIKHFEHKCLFFNNIFEYSKLPVVISSKIPTESNVNFKVINKILKFFNLEELPANDFERRLDKLLTYRNSIAHGENSLPVTEDLIQAFNSTVIDAMHEVTIRITDGFSNKKYLRV